MAPEVSRLSARIVSLLLRGGRLALVTDRVLWKLAHVTPDAGSLRHDVFYSSCVIVEEGHSISHMVSPG